MTILEWIGFTGLVLFCLIMIYPVIYAIKIILTKNEDE